MTGLLSNDPAAGLQTRHGQNGFDICSERPLWRGRGELRVFVILHCSKFRRVDYKGMCKGAFCGFGSAYARVQGPSGLLQRPMR